MLFRGPFETLFFGSNGTPGLGSQTSDLHKRLRQRVLYFPLRSL